MLIEGFQHKHALGQNSRQHHNHHIPAITSVEKPARSLGILFMVLYYIKGVAKPVRR